MLLAEIVQVPAVRIVSAPVVEFTEHTDVVVEAKTIVPVLEGVEVALTECVPANSP